MQRLPGKRPGTHIFFYNGFSYHLDGSSTDGNIYRCSSRSTTKCCGSLRDDNGRIVVLHEHNQDAMNPHLYEEHVMRLEVLRLCRETLRTFDDIIREVSLAFPLAARNVTLTRMRRSMERERGKIRPAVPRNLREFAEILRQFPGELQIYRGMVRGADRSVAVVFASDVMIQRLGSASTLFVDATFRVVPTRPKARQLLIVFIRRMDVAFPAAYIFCQSKTTEMYVAIWEFLINLVPEMRVNLQTVVSDYESAIITSVRTVFLQATSRGCWFHFCRAVYKKWGSLGLREAPKDVLWMAMSIALVPAQRFDECFDVLMRNGNAIVATYPAITAFLRYFLRQWRPLAAIVAVGRDALRTNNTCETFNRYIVGRLGGAHPNVWIPVEKLDELIRYTEINWQQLEAGQPITRGRTHVQAERDATIRTLQERLEEQDITLEEFLRRIMVFPQRHPL